VFLQTLGTSEVDTKTKPEFCLLQSNTTLNEELNILANFATLHPWTMPLDWSPFNFI